MTPTIADPTKPRGTGELDQDIGDGADSVGRGRDPFHDAAPVTDDRRVDHLESVLDSVANQVDRLASGQDFLSRVVGERSARIPERPQADTPH